jgi:Sec-independent protein translocase protein TatA
MFSLSPMKFLVIVAVVVMLLGPDKLPEVAHKLGSTWQSLRRFQQRVESEVRGAIPDLPSTSDIARMARSPVTVLNQLADRAQNAPLDADDGDAQDPDVDIGGGAPLMATRERPLVNPPTSSPSTEQLSADPSLN